MSVEVERKVDEKGTIRWYKKGTEILHREDGPAMEYFDGDKFWFQNNKLHRLDGPACEYSNGDKHWYRNDELHCSNGPAIDSINNHKEYWFWGKKYPETFYWSELVIKKCF